MKDGAAMLRFAEFGGSEIRTVEFAPVYLSVVDDFAEDFSGFCKNESSVEGPDLLSVQNNISQNFPSAKASYDDLRAFQLSAMEWRVRFICQGEPKMTVATK